MTILALEFSSDARGVALVRDGQVLGQAGESGGRSTHAFRLIEQVLAQAAVEREAVEVVALGLGPGSYAGIRVAIAIAQGWQLARAVRLLGLSTVEVLAEQARASGGRGRLHVAIDAQRGEFYHATYELDDTLARTVTPLRVATLDDVRQAAGAEPVVGDAAVAAKFPGGRVLIPEAATLCRLATGRTDFLTAGQLQPIYLRETSFVKAPPPRTIAVDPS